MFHSKLPATPNCITRPHCWGSAWALPPVLGESEGMGWGWGVRGRSAKERWLKPEARPRRAERRAPQARASVRSRDCRRAWLRARVGRCLASTFGDPETPGLRSFRKSREWKACGGECVFCCPGAGRSGERASQSSEADATKPLQGVTGTRGRICYLVSCPPALLLLAGSTHFHSVDGF